MHTHDAAHGLVLKSEIFSLTKPANMTFLRVSIDLASEPCLAGGQFVAGFAH